MGDAPRDKSVRTPTFLKPRIPTGMLRVSLSPLLKRKANSRRYHATRQATFMNAGMAHSDVAKYEVFHSYHGLDRPLARQVYEALAAAGLRVWFDVEVLHGATSGSVKSKRASQLPTHSSSS